MPSRTQRLFSAGGLVFKKENNQVLYLLRLPKANPGYHAKIVWTLPKGWLDDTDGGKSPGPLATGHTIPTESQIQTAALKEVEEEAGIQAQIIQKLATIKYFFDDHNQNRILKVVTFYLMEYIKNSPKGHNFETEAVIWLSYEKAKTQLAYPNEASLLTQAHRELTSLAK